MDNVGEGISKSATEGGQRLSTRQSRVRCAIYTVRGWRWQKPLGSAEFVSIQNLAFPPASATRRLFSCRHQHMPSVQVALAESKTYPPSVTNSVRDRSPPQMWLLRWPRSSCATATFG
jgi:hypothetical protein